MYTQILIPLDGSKVAEQVLPYARLLATALAIPVHLLEVIELDELEMAINPGQDLYLDTLLTYAATRGRTYLNTVAQSLQATEVVCSVDEGKPEEVLIEKAAASKNTLIIMATHGRSGYQRWLLGSVAEKVVHGAANDTFLIRATEQAKSDGIASLKTVVVPLDGSPLAERVLPRVESLAKSMDLEIILLRAYALLAATLSDEFRTLIQERVGNLQREANDYVSAKSNEMRVKGFQKVSSVVKCGSAAEEIIRVAEQIPEAFIAMCAHGRSGIRRWMLGSVAEKVVRHSGHSVLIVRAT